ncbi:hypothetical protein BKA69DRAFT_1034764 [Paraphysoderma sedebokerense]|nr:hypothetical protein BKA69DRAFT_1034764 [Paraphysoderma sedebokerense]
MQSKKSPTSPPRSIAINIPKSPLTRHTIQQQSTEELPGSFATGHRRPIDGDGEGSVVQESTIDNHGDDIHEDDRETYQSPIERTIKTVEAVTVENVLQENQSFDSKEQSVGAQMSNTTIRKSKSKTLDNIASFTRWSNLFRAGVTTTFGIYQSVRLLNDEFYRLLHTEQFLYANIIFLVLDLVLTIVRTFPNSFDKYVRNVKKPLERNVSIWALVADPDLIIDTIFLMPNIILKLYSFRLGELITNHNIKTLVSLEVSYNSNLIFDENLIQLIVFYATLMSTLAFYTIHICYTLVTNHRSYFLSSLIFVKFIFVSFDIFICSILLYETLVTRNFNLFQLTVVDKLVLSVIAVSPFVNMVSNTFINFPLHYSFIRTSLKDRLLIFRSSFLPTPTSSNLTPSYPLEVAIGTGSNIPFARVFKASLRKTFHPIVNAIFGTYTLYSLISIYLTVGYLLQLDSFTTVGVLLFPGLGSPTSTPTLSPSNSTSNGTIVFPNGANYTVPTNITLSPNGTLSSTKNEPQVDVAFDDVVRNATDINFWFSETRKSTVLILVWINVIINYAPGAITCVLYWTKVFLEGLAISRLLKWVQTFVNWCLGTSKADVVHLHFDLPQRQSAEVSNLQLPETRPIDSNNEVEMSKKPESSVVRRGRTRTVSFPDMLLTENDHQSPPRARSSSADIFRRNDRIMLHMRPSSLATLGVKRVERTKSTSDLD